VTWVTHLLLPAALGQYTFRGSSDGFWVNLFIASQPLTRRVPAA
jgi:hypothetical protein